MSTRMQLHRAVQGTASALALLGALVLGGCAGPAQLPLGSDRVQVQQALGSPTAEYAAVSAENLPHRLQYSW